MENIQSHQFIWVYNKLDLS